MVMSHPHAAGLERAVVGAVAGTDAAVVDHHIEAILAVDRGIDGADCFAGSGFAVLAGHGLDEHFRVVHFVFVP